ncbi:PucR C-terminal helix-turn-helix domain-containing protein [Nocardioides terrae]|uniref:PucR C-terminal helix-turn-helix domain-containing protein n=1 Tax=Nocardioides terrae TaxID=574651 RepID=A0A1I1EW73_9ACTN|nr:helix-turn-helix domain-containing protein [Nocardioides terrae]SFB90956.1 PucR C-terminal helix-turn-helix domain-containing protein [Nocardioides terrae]
MTRPLSLRTAPTAVRLPGDVAERMRLVLPAIGEKVVATIIAEVPSYQDALSGAMGETIRTAVGIALDAFIAVASNEAEDVPMLTAQARQGAFDLGRGEARSGRTTEALLAAYRIGARISWRELSSTAVEAGLSPEGLAEFAGLVFSYIDELSDVSAAGHADELATTGRARQRMLELLARRLLHGDAVEAVDEAVQSAGWTPPATLTAALMPSAEVGGALAGVPSGTLVLTELAEADDLTLLLVPDVHGSARTALLRTLSSHRATVGPPRPWRDVRVSFDRALRARAVGLGPDTEEHLVTLVLGADAEALADLRATVLAPLSSVRPAVAEKLTETLRCWLLHHGRRDEVAAALFVHPQTVRYRMGQLRDLFGDSLEDPATVLALTVALG